MFNGEDKPMARSLDANPLLIQKTANVSGGDACLGETRIPVWVLVALKQRGASEEVLLRNYPGLDDEHLAAAWEYYRQNTQEIQEAIQSNEDESDES